MPCVWRRNPILTSLVASMALAFSGACAGNETATGASPTTAAAAGAPGGTAMGPGVGPGGATQQPAVGGTGGPAQVATPPVTGGPGNTATPPTTMGGPTAGTGSSTTPPGPGVVTEGSGAPANPHWLSYGNGAKNQFYNAAETKISVESAPMLSILWMAQVGEVTGAPAVVGDTVYAASNAGLVAVDAATGMMKWTLPIRSTSGPFYDEESKMLIVSASGGTLHGVDATTGMMKWSGRISMQGGTNGWSSPVVSGKYAVIGVGAIDMGNFKGGIAVFDKLTGAKKFEYTHCGSGNGASVWSGPGADDDGVIYGTTGNNYGSADDRSDAIFAMMPSDSAGMMLWNFQAEKNDAWSFSTPNGGPDHDFGANPIIVDVKGRKLIAAGAKSGIFHLVDRMTGQEIANHKISMVTSQANGGILNNGAYDGKNELFIAAANEGGAPGNTVAMSADPDKMLAEAWKIPNAGVMWGQISTANGVCFIPDDNTLRVVNCMDGKDLVKIPVPGTIGSAPAVSEGRVFFGSGFTYGLSPGIKGGRNLIAVGFK